MLQISQTYGLALTPTLTCGQCFRWQEQPDGSHVGIVGDQAVRAEQLPDGALTLTGLAGPDPAENPDFWHRYLALDIDYPALQDKLCAVSPRLAACVEASPGIRVLRQPFFETLITFLISQNNNIPRIKGIVGRLCETLGEPLPLPPGTEGSGVYHAFPTPERLAGQSEADLAFLRAGWRTGYLLDAARRLAEGSLSEQQLTALPTAEARALLRTVKGVGPKVADCTLLFGLGRFDAYPIDVWMKRADKAVFPHSRDAGAYLNRRTGGMAGIAQQYLFAWARENL